MQDKVLKDRCNKILSHADIRAIRRIKLKQQYIADLFGVCRATVSHIKTGKRWGLVI